MTVLADWEAAQTKAERRRWSLSTLAIVLSGSAVAVGLHWQSSRPPPVLPPAAAMVIELAALQAPPQPSAQPEGPAQVEAPKPTPQPEPKPKIELPRSEIALPQPQEIEKPREEQPPAPETTAPASVPAPPSPAASAPRQSASSAAAVAAQATFEQLLLGHLERHKRYPRAAQMRRQQGVPYIRFTMDRQGTVLAASLERPSGFALLDQEALALLERAQPLPRLPDTVAGNSLEIVVPIEFFISR